jgi:hypothetical protein
MPVEMPDKEAELTSFNAAICTYQLMYAHTELDILKLTFFNCSSS